MDSCYGIRSAPGDRCTPINQTSGLAAKTAKYENCLHVLTAAQKANIPYAAVVTPLDINNGNQTAILNLVWGLISFTWLRDKPGSTATDARKTLLDWVNSRIKDSGPPVIDFCHSWHDGTALCRLLNSFIPNSLSPGKLTQDSTGNLLLVLEKISSVLAILPWIESWEAATAMEPEERCIMTYIGEFYNYGRRHNSASVVVVSPAEEKLRREKAQLELEMRQLQHTQSILKVRANETERMLSPVIKEGFLVKQGKVVKSWKRRWFALKQDGLYYFSNRTDWKPLGAIPLSQIVKIGAAEDTKNSSWIVPAHASPYTFVIKSEQRDLYCTCTCESEMQDWINTINTLLERTRT
ncbi:hypothetical protein Pelo_573 [Pelomyxa schiedti]|nr:hypothetical protein Pelo_573 [Pelomyxa schiedti]